MPDYRRNRVPGGTFFVTANLLDRRSGLLVTQTGALKDAIGRVRRHAPFPIEAWVGLPDDGDDPGRWQAIKTCTRQRTAITGHVHRR
jgi:REP-associated tyrosine transposase